MDMITSQPAFEQHGPHVTSSDTAVVFTGRRSDFRRLVTRGALLELVTFGFYRFWLVTRMRRHLWSNTVTDGDAPEYNGTPKELLIGFLFAIAVLGPVYLGYFLLGLEAERLQAFASFPLIILFYLFMQFALYRARRYRLTRTVWRGVRFGMGGSGLSYMWRAGLWTLLAVVTLGLAFPWRQAALERFKMRHTSYGELQGQFSGTGGQLFRRVWPLWLTVVVLLVVMPIVSAVLKTSVLAFVAVAVMIVSQPFLYARYKALEWRWWVCGMRVGEVSFESQLGAGDLIGLYWKVVGWSFLILAGFIAWFAGIVAIVMLMSGGGDISEQIALVSHTFALWVVMVVGYVGALLSFWVVMRLYLMHDIWQRVAETTTVHNIAAAQTATAQGGMVGALGEGFADSLDVGGF
jgi:uncharacterized membrane protein YjgN (DUF898 family)